MPKVAKGFLYLIYGIIVAGLIAAIVVSLHNNNSSKSKPTAHKPVTSQSQKPAPKTGSTPSESGSSGSNNAAGSQSSANASKQAGNTGNSAAGPAPQLSNTGPGDTIGLFVLTTLTGTLLYRRRLVRRLN